MAEQQEVTVRQMTIHLQPYDTPEAQDYYMNLTGVVNTQHEVVLMFVRVLPMTTVPEGSAMNIAPALRVAIPVAAARHLIEQLQQMVDLRERQEGLRGSEESGG